MPGGCWGEVGMEVGIWCYPVSGSKHKARWTSQGECVYTGRAPRPGALAVEWEESPGDTGVTEVGGIASECMTSLSCGFSCNMLLVGPPRQHWFGDALPMTHCWSFFWRQLGLIQCHVFHLWHLSTVPLCDWIVPWIKRAGREATAVWMDEQAAFK